MDEKKRPLCLYAFFYCLGLFFLLFFSRITYSAPNARNVYVPQASNLSPGGFESKFLVSKEDTVGLYDYYGDEVEFVGDEAYARFNYSGLFRYGLLGKLNFNFGFNGRSNRYTESSGKSFDIHGLESLGLGVRYALLNRPSYSLAMDFQYKKLLNQAVTIIDQGKGVLDHPIGDEGHGFHGGFLGALRLMKGLTWEKSFGLALPAKERNLEAYFDSNLHWSRGRFALGAGIDGIYTLLNGSDEGVSKPEYLTNTINSKDPIYYRSYGSVMLGLYRGLRLEFKTGQVFLGQAWDRNGFFSLALAYRETGREPAMQKERVEQQFKEYDIEANVIEVSPRGILIKIDRGVTENIDSGMPFDIYQVDALGNSILIASGTVFKAVSERAVIKIIKTYREDRVVQTGNVARGKFNY